MNRCIKITHKLCLGCGQERASFLRRWKSKKADHWAMVKRRQSGPSLALKHFDHFYPETYGGARWRSMRLALLSRSKPAALVNHFGDVDGTCERLTAAGSLDLTAELRAQISRLQVSESSDTDRTSSLPSPAHTSPVSAGATTSPTATAAAVALEAETAAEAEAEAAGRLRVLEPTDPSSSAVLHDYVPASQLHGDDDWLEEGDYFQFAQEDGSLRVALDRDGPVNIPETLRMFSFPAGDISRFPYPQTTASGAKDYYPMDGASLLPVLALDVQPGDSVLDLCAAPGGKSLALLQTLRPASLVCNDTQAGRVRRLKQVLLDYLPPPDSWPCRVNVTKSDGRRMQERAQYDKVLVDVPCFSDRHVLADEENNLFAINRSRERIQIPQLQTDLLRRAIEAVRPGGTVVYSTCTLSPVQNDGVVHMALKMLWEDTDVQVVVKDMTQAMRPFYGTFWFARGCGVKYGQMVLPSVVNNFGPMYFAKIVRVK